MVIDFLAPFLRDANIQKIFGAQTFETIPTFLTVFAKSQYDAKIEMIPSQEGEFSGWTEAE